MIATSVSPDYILKQDYLEVPEGSSPAVSFTVSSEPPLADDVKHTLATSEGARVTKRFKIENGSITFRNVTPKDSRVYIISCHNDDGKVGRGEIELEVIPALSTGAAGFTAPTDSQTGKLVYRFRIVLMVLINFMYRNSYDTGLCELRIGLSLQVRIQMECYRCFPQIPIC